MRGGEGGKGPPQENERVLSISIQSFSNINIQRRKFTMFHDCLTDIGPFNHIVFFENSIITNFQNAQCAVRIEVSILWMNRRS